MHAGVEAKRRAALHGLRTRHKHASPRTGHRRRRGLDERRSRASTQESPHVAAGSSSGHPLSGPSSSRPTAMTAPRTTLPIPPWRVCFFSSTDTIRVVPVDYCFWVVSLFRIERIREQFEKDSRKGGKRESKRARTFGFCFCFSAPTPIPSTTWEEQRNQRFRCDLFSLIRKRKVPRARRRSDLARRIQNLAFRKRSSPDARCCLEDVFGGGNLCCLP